MLFAVLSALGFGLWSICLERALRRGVGPSPAILTMSVAILVSHLPPILWLGADGSLPPLRLPGLTWFAAAGLLTAGLGPLYSVWATGRIGAARINALRLLDPFFAYVIALVFLGERLQAGAVGGILLIAMALGLLRLETRAEEGQAGRSGMLSGVGFGVLASLTFTVGTVARKLGLALVPSALVGGLIEGLMGLVLILSAAALRGTWQDLWPVSRRLGADLWWAGAAAAGATLALNLALQRVPVPVAVALRNTSPWFVLLLVPLLLGRQWRPTRWTWASTALLTVGMLLIVNR